MGVVMAGSYYYNSCDRERGRGVEGRSEGREATNLGGSAASLQLGVRLPEVAQPEVRDDGLGVVLVQQDVLELDVSVNDFLVVEMPDPGQDLSEECPEASNIKNG